MMHLSFDRVFLMHSLNKRLLVARSKSPRQSSITIMSGL